MTHNTAQEEAEGYVKRVYANTLIVLGLSLWILAVAVTVALPYADMRWAASAWLQGLQLEDSSFWWTLLPFVAMGLAVGGFISGSLIAGGELCGTLLDERDNFITLERRAQSLADKVLRDYERERDRAETAERHCEQLCQEVGRLNAETERLEGERREIADSLTQVVNEVLPRIRRQDG